MKELQQKLIEKQKELINLMQDAFKYQADDKITEYCWNEVNILLSEISQLEQSISKENTTLDPTEDTTEILNEREALFQAFDKIRASFKGRHWLIEGRGCYPYDDERYKEEVRYIMDEFEEINTDLWKQIKSKSFEYRKSIEEPLKKRIVELEASQLKENTTRTAEEIQSTKESIYIERIKNLQAIIRHCDCPVYGNPRFDMVVELTKKDKEFALAINLLNDANASQFNPIEAKETKELYPKEFVEWAGCHYGYFNQSWSLIGLKESTKFHTTDELFDEYLTTVKK